MNDATTSPRTAQSERLQDPVETQAPSRGWTPPRSRWTWVFVAAVIAGVLLALYAWGLPPFTNRVQTTDNAYVRGQTTVIAPQVNGYVTKVLVQDFATVKAGQLLAVIDQRIYRQRVQQAHAAISAAEANLANSEQSQRSSEAGVASQAAAIANARAQLARAQADMRRVNELVGEGSVSLRERDQTLAALRAAEAGVAQAQAQHTVAREQVRTVTVGRGGLQAAVENAQAQLRLAEIDLDNTEIRAPIDGTLGEVGVRLGQYVTAGTQLTFLVPRAIWVTANFKEAQLAHMAPGQLAEIRVDALGRRMIHGKVESIAPAAGNEFSVIRPDNATGNFVKVAQRIPVRLALDAADPLYPRLSPGMSVTVRVDTR